MLCFFTAILGRWIKLYIFIACRDHSLSTLAILNSARKAFLRAQENSPSGSVKKASRKSCLAAEDKSAGEEDGTGPLTVRVRSIRHYM